jgi:phospholipase/lecithinase/hemolysin
LTAAEAALKIAGVNIYFVDVEQILRDAQADPAKYGFLHITSLDSCSAATCTSQPLSVQNTYIFNDVIHLTSAFDMLIAQEAAGMIAEAGVPETSTWAMMILGFAGIGFMAYRRRNPSVALRAA